MCHFKECSSIDFTVQIHPIMKNFFIFILCLFAFGANAMEKKTTFDKALFEKAQSEGKVIVISSWIEYCGSCANQMKVLQTAKKEGELSDIKFDNIEYFAFDVTNREISDMFNVQYQTTLLIFKNNKEVYRSIGEIKKEAIYKALKSSI